MEQAVIKVYTREPQAVGYPNGLAYSIHMACRLADGEFQTMNKNYGILFAKGEISTENTIIPLALKNLRIVLLEDSYGIIAERIKEDGDVDNTSEGKLLLWTTKDFIYFEEKGLMDAEDFAGYPQYVFVETSVAEQALQYWNTLVNTAVKLPEQAEVTSAQELAEIKALAIYSDGSLQHQRSYQPDEVSISIGKGLRRSGAFSVGRKVVLHFYQRQY